ncbi:B-cell receptor CD22-like [Leptodactylus fuscus]|uniref:B-cell receptor CD22-like n=1 Tax=Leptodactylus fuscus TaxID=238119 RepID=UPI003F4EF27F
MEFMKQIYLLLICQGFYLGSVCQRWTFPSRIVALIGSCVEIPCTYHPAGISGSSSTVWYSYRYHNTDLEILNTEGSLSVIEDYKDRTSLVPGNNSCSLRIDPVRRGDFGKYYPGIAEDKDINSLGKLNKTVHLYVTDVVNLHLHVSYLMADGEATTIRCSVDHTCGSRPLSLRWNKPGQVKRKSVEISEGSWREESELTYIPSYVDDGSPIECSATYLNNVFTKTSRTLNIIYAPQNVTVTFIEVVEAIEGIDMTLQCNSFSKFAILGYEWYKGKTRLPVTGREIKVRNVKDDMEPYSCAAINRVGRGESAPTQIPLLYATIGVHSTMKNDQEFTVLTCHFLRSQPDVTHYTWMKDGSILQNETEKTLTLEDNEKSYGQYSCIVHNSVGNSSDYNYPNYHRVFIALSKDQDGKP